MPIKSMFKNRQAAFKQQVPYYYYMQKVVCSTNNSFLI